MMYEVNAESLAARLAWSSSDFGPDRVVMDLTVIDLSFESLQRQGPWLVFMLLLHPLLGWLFGSYTVLRWRSFL